MFRLYVDNGRHWSTVLRKGMRFDEKLGEFQMDEEQYEGCRGR